MCGERAGGNFEQTGIKLLAVFLVKKNCTTSTGDVVYTDKV